MKKAIKYWQTGGFVFIAITGVLLHFLYDWTNQSVLVAPFSAVNESIWEHMKLLFFPMYVFALIEYRFAGKEYENFWCVKLAGILTGIMLIPIIYYTYTGALGINSDFVNIAIYFATAGTALYFETAFLNLEIYFCKSQIAAFVILTLLAIAFVALTFVPPKIPLFQDPATGSFGI